MSQCQAPDVFPYYCRPGLEDPGGMSTPPVPVAAPAQVPGLETVGLKKRFISYHRTLLESSEIYKKLTVIIKSYTDFDPLRLSSRVPRHGS